LRLQAAKQQTQKSSWSCEQETLWRNHYRQARQRATEMAQRKSNALPKVQQNAAFRRCKQNRQAMWQCLSLELAMAVMQVFPLSSSIVVQHSAESKRLGVRWWSGKNIRIQEIAFSIVSQMARSRAFEDFHGPRSDHVFLSGGLRKIRVIFKEQWSSPTAAYHCCQGGELWTSSFVRCLNLVTTMAAR
jgi:hypothetical protein